jgi:Na+-translocating ferredoxin:NAD+ oxidoreductase subunit B
VTTLHPNRHLLVERIHAALPQTQCTRCGYPDCAAYAQAIAAGSAAINQCPPGGAEGVQRLAAITGLPVQPLNPLNGLESPRNVAIIDEAWCIGCTLCIKACPTDAILGSNKMMHTIIEPYCTGCELCVPVCPVDCISFENVTGERTGWQAWSQSDADTALERYKFHSTTRPPTLPQGPEEQLTLKPQAEPPVVDKKQAVIEAALARSRAARQQQK